MKIKFDIIYYINSIAYDRFIFITAIFLIYLRGTPFNAITMVSSGKVRFLKNNRKLKKTRKAKKVCY